MTAEQKSDRIPAIFYCFRYPHVASTATILKIGASLPEGPGVSLGREEDKEFARQRTIPELTRELVRRSK